jgi:glycolate oxidase
VSRTDTPAARGAGPGLAPADATFVEALAELRAAVPGVSVDPADLAADATDVEATLAWASRHRVPVVPRGAGSGLAGAAVAGPGAIVLDLSGLDRIVRLEPADGYAVVEPGVVTADLDRAARAHGLQYAPDPGSVEISTIGGNIATNAGGLRCVKHGVTRDAVLGLDVVLADGTRVTTGTGSVRGVAGYDLTSLLVGSEGTLGVVVGATVRLVPTERDAITVTGNFASVEHAAAAAAEVIATGITPGMLELLDAATLRALDDLEGTDLATAGGALLIGRTDGFAAAAEADAIAGIFRERTDAVALSGDPVEAEHLVRARRQALPSIEARGRVLIEDIAVPRTRLAEAVRTVGHISAETGVEVFVFAHAGAGILHPIVLVGDRPADDPAVRDTADRIFGLALELGGTVTGEHGVGLLKRQWLHRELGPAAVSLHERIKSALDPLDILNPGKGI